MKSLYTKHMEDYEMETKKEASHTPIPWKLSERSKAVVTDQFNKAIASCVQVYREHATCEANTAFIVEAVNSYDDLKRSHAELLEAVKKLFEYFQNEQREVIKHQAMDLWPELERINTVIKNAEKVQK